MTYPGYGTSSTPPDEPSNPTPPAEASPTPPPPGAYPPVQPGYTPPPPPAAPPAQPVYTPPPTYPPPPQPAYAPQPPPAYAPPPAAPTTPPPGVPGQPPAYPPAGPQTTAGLPPVPVAPTYDPAAVAAQQFSAPPVSGPYGYVTPLASAIPAPPPASRGRATIVLAVLATVFLLVAGVTTTLFIIKSAEASRLDSQVTDLTGQNSSKGAKIQELTKDLDGTKRDLQDSDGRLDEMTKQKKALADCLNAFYEANRAFDAANGQRTPEVDAKIAEYDRLCTIADKYL